MPTCITGRGATLTFSGSSGPDGTTPYTTADTLVTNLEIQSMSALPISQGVLDAPKTSDSQGAYRRKCWEDDIDHGSFETVVYHNTSDDFSTLVGAEGTLTRLVGGGGAQNISGTARCINADLMPGATLNELSMSTLTWQFDGSDLAWAAS